MYRMLVYFIEQKFFYTGVSIRPRPPVSLSKNELILNVATLAAVLHQTSQQ